MNDDSYDAVKNDTISDYFYSRALFYNKQLDEVMTLLENYYSQLSSKLTEATNLLNENSSLYFGIADYISKIKKEVDNCNDEIIMMKRNSVITAIMRDTIAKKNNYGGENNE